LIVFIDMSPLYEVDPNADVLVIVPGHDQHDHVQDHRGVNGHLTNGNVNGNGHAVNGSAHHKHHHNGHHHHQNDDSDHAALRLKVSSRHLVLASKYFRNRLTWGTLSADEIDAHDGRVHIHLAHDVADPAAAKIVFDIIHGRGSRVPRTLDPDVLVKVTKMVERFGCVEAVDVYADRWFAGLEQHNEEDEHNKLAVQIYLAHVFRRPDVFRRATRDAILASTGPLVVEGVPLREKIIREYRTAHVAFIILSPLNLFSLLLSYMWHIKLTSLHF
jgi:hypothetical protein